MKKAIREEVHEKFGSCCAYCGDEIEYKAMQVDHVIPQYNYEFIIRTHQQPEFLKHLTVSDVHHIDNLFPTCRVCNKWKSTFSVNEFRYEISKQLERTNEKSSNYRLAKKYGQVKETPTNIIFEFEKWRL